MGTSNVTVMTKTSKMKFKLLSRTVSVLKLCLLQLLYSSNDFLNTYNWNFFSIVMRLTKLGGSKVPTLTHSVPSTFFVVFARGPNVSHLNERHLCIYLYFDFYNNKNKKFQAFLSDTPLSTGHLKYTVKGCVLLIRQTVISNTVTFEISRTFVNHGAQYATQYTRISTVQ